MAAFPNHIFSVKVVAKWEKLYHLLGRSYGYIAHHPDIETEDFILFASIDIASIEGTVLEKEYRTFPTLFINFLRAYQDADRIVIVAHIVKAHYQDRLKCLELADFVTDNCRKAIKFAQEQVSQLVREKGKLVERIALTMIYFEYDLSDIVMKFRCDWLEEKLQDVTLDIALERELIRNPKLAAEHHETSIAKLKEKCNRLFFKLADLDFRST